MEEIILLRIVKNIGESAITSSTRCTRVFFQIGLKFPSDREDFFVEMYILLGLVVLGPYEEEKSGKQMI